MKNRRIKWFLASTGLILVLAFVFIWFGVYNIAANEKHWAVTTALLDLIRERSIEVRLDEIQIPQTASADSIARGAIGYAEMCEQCHLAPGKGRTELYEGLYPQPPVFHQRDNSEHDPRELFWVIKNGIKLTAMPAWEKSHTDQQIWEIVAFISDLDQISPEQYQQLSKAGEREDTGGATNDKH